MHVAALFSFNFSFEQSVGACITCLSSSYTGEDLAMIFSSATLNQIRAA